MLCFREHNSCEWICKHPPHSVKRGGVQDVWLKLSATDISQHEEMEISVIFSCFQSAEVFGWCFFFFLNPNSFRFLVKLKRWQSPYNFSIEFIVDVSLCNCYITQICYTKQLETSFHVLVVRLGVWHCRSFHSIPPHQKLWELHHPTLILFHFQNTL